MFQWWKSTLGFLNNSLKLIKDIIRKIQNNIDTEINLILHNELIESVFYLEIWENVNTFLPVRM